MTILNFLIGLWMRVQHDGIEESNMMMFKRSD